MSEETETPPQVVRVTVLTAVGFGFAYLLWRVGWTRNGTEGWMFWTLWLAELTLWLSVGRFAAETWTLRFDPVVTRELDDAALDSVDVVIIARDEPTEVLRATLLGCADLLSEHRTVVLDTIGRPSVAQLAADLGAEVLTPGGLAPDAQPEAQLDAALEDLDGDLIALLRGDDVPRPDMIERLAGDFEDESVWVSQGRQAVYGPSASDYEGASDELAFFFGVVQPGKNHHGAGYWCGSGSLLRRATISHVGGIPTETDTPGFQMSLAAHEAGWQSRYHGEATVLTLARPDLEGFVAQHALWASGNLQSLRTRRSPLWSRGLNLGQRMSYLSSITTYLSGPRQLAIVTVLVATLLGAGLPITAEPVYLVSAWGIWMGLAVLARRGLSRGHGGGITALGNQWLLMGAYCSAWLSLLVPRSVAASVRTPPPTPGHRHRRPRVRARLLAISLVGVGVAMLARLGELIAPSPLPEMGAAASAISLLAAVGLLGLLGMVLFRGSRRTRRADPRFSVESRAHVGGNAVELIEVSEGGASIRMRASANVGRPYVVGLALPGLDGTVHECTVAAEVRSVRPAPPPQSGHIVGLSFTHLSPTARERLAEYCRVLLPARAAAVATEEASKASEAAASPEAARQTLRG
ncbi:MAG: glycosyltransferase family 2 protein, partial [Microthrixaceae bacterium]